MSIEEWMEPRFEPASTQGWRGHMLRVIFHHHVPYDRRFEIVLLGVIVIRVFMALLDNVALPHVHYGDNFRAIEWVFTIAFSVEYLLRLSLVRRLLRYALSFYGLVDLAAALPSSIGLFIVAADHLLVVRALRILRVFCIHERIESSNEGSELMRALHASRRKIGMFVLSVLLITVIFGAVMHLVEGP